MIDLFTPETMDAVVRVMPTQNTFFRNTFFGTTKLEPTEKIRVDFYKGKRRVAPFVSANAIARVSEKIGFVSDELLTPHVKVKDVTDIQDIMKRLPAEVLMGSGMSPDERAVQLLANVLSDFNEQIIRREEVMCAQAMLNGAITLIGEGVNSTVDFGFTNTDTLTSTAMWDNASSVADPLADLKKWAVVCQKNGYRKPNICVMERSAYAAFITRCKALNYFSQWNFLDLSILPIAKDENLTYCGRLRDPDMEIYIYDEWYIDDWTDPTTPTEKAIMSKGKVMLASTNAKFSMYYGVMTFSDPNTNSLRSVMGARAADSWIQKEPAQRFLTLNSRPLPVPHEVDSWYVATVSATV